MLAEDLSRVSKGAGERWRGESFRRRAQMAANGWLGR